MEIGAITGYIDVAQVTLYAFWAFFAGLIFYLRQEDRREGYPLVSEDDGRPIDPGVIFMPEPKTFRLASGRIVYAPSDKVDTRVFALKPAEVWPGTPYDPTGNPMLDGVGPASYALRPDVVDVTHHGTPRIVPLRVAKDFFLPPGDLDPRGMAVMAGDNIKAGVVRDLWVDRAEQIIRYIEVDVAGTAPAKSVLLPMNFARLNRTRRAVEVSAIMAQHFTDVPALANPEQVTLLEEDRICGYYGGGTLFASSSRRGPKL